MRFVDTKFENVYLLKLNSKFDSRGDFTRLFCEKIFQDNNVSFNIVQSSLTSNNKKFTLRGLHYQDKPNQENKILFCIKGKIWDVLVDLRKNSKNFGKWISFALSEKEGHGLFIPKGFAHGYITLTCDTKLIYFMDEFYNPKSSKGLIWCDKEVKIEWPYHPQVISERDKNLPTLNEIRRIDI